MSTPSSPPARPPFGLWIAAGVLIAGTLAGLGTLGRPGSGPPLRIHPPAGDPPEGMVWVPGGRFRMGSDAPADVSKDFDRGPSHLVELDGFWMDRTEVTNDQFAAFVKATGYETIAEQPVDPAIAPEGATPEMLKPFSAVFVPPEGPIDLQGPPVWWQAVQGASWRHPEGPGSDLTGRGNHPVVQIAWDDAVAYAKWAGKRLPTEAEWEYAARGGLAGKEFGWGDELNPGGRWMANTWQGPFPHGNTAEDGYVGTAPVGSYPANGYGLHDLAGNVWEWCADWYQPDYYRHSPRRNPPGPEQGQTEMGQPQRVRRGGSFLCSDLYCRRYLPAARDKNPPDSAANHTGFRCVREP